MKQTNNAIKFLMAQYRAIFQNAYFKGLATAAVVTMGLAAGQAQAAQETSFSQDSDALATITIDGVNHETTDKDVYTKIAVTASPSAPEKFANTEIIVNKGETTANTITSANELSFKGKSLTVNTTANAGHGLAISTIGSAANKTATVTFTEAVTLTRGVVSLTGSDSATASLVSKEITVGDGTNATATNAQLKLAKNGVVGSAIEPSSVFGDLNTITLKSGGTITTVVAKAQDKGTINAGTFNVTGGDIVSVSGGSNEAGILELNLVQGTISAGNVKVDQGSSLNINFKEAKAATGSTQTAENTLAITGGSISGAGAIVVSGDATTKGVLTINAGENGVNLENATGDLKIAANATLATDMANLDALAASTLKTTISGGTLKFTDTENIDLTADKFAGTAAAGSKIGLSNNATISGNELSLAADIGTVTVEANTINLKNPTGTALTTTGVKANSVLNVGADSKVQSVTLSAGDIKAINDAHANDAAEVKDNNIKAAALAESGSFGTVEGVSEGTLTIDAASGKLDVVNGTWTNNNVNVVLGGTNEVALTVGKEDATHKTASKLVFNNGSKLEIAKGTISVGNTNANVLGAELDISALDSESLVFTSGTITAAKNGLIKANSELLTQVFANDQDKLTIGNGGSNKNPVGSI